MSFGNGDICISNHSNISQKNICNLGWSYEAPNGLKKNSNLSKAYLAGSINFRLKEIEIYSVLF